MTGFHMNGTQPCTFLYRLPLVLHLGKSSRVCKQVLMARLALIKSYDNKIMEGLDFQYHEADLQRKRSLAYSLPIIRPETH